MPPPPPSPTPLSTFLSTSLPSLGIDPDIYTSFIIEIFSHAPDANSIQEQVDEAKEILQGANGGEPPITDDFLLDLAASAQLWLTEKHAVDSAAANTVANSKQALDKVLAHEKSIAPSSSLTRHRGPLASSNLTAEARAVIMRFQNETVFSSDEDEDDEEHDTTTTTTSTNQPSTNKKITKLETTHAAFDAVFGASANRAAAQQKMMQDQKARAEKAQTHVAKSKEAAQADREMKDAKKQERRDKANNKSGGGGEKKR